MVTLGFQSFLLGMLQKMSNFSWLSGYFFLNSFDPGKKIKPEQLHCKCYAAKMYESVSKKGLCQVLFEFRHISSVYNLLLNTTIFTVV